MLRLYEKNNQQKYRDFEDFLFTYPENHDISFDFANDVCSIDSVDYRISSLKNPILQTSTIQDYVATKTDEQSSPQYYGFIKKTKDKSLIMKVTTTQILYFIGAIADFTIDWNNRTELTFNEPQNIEL